MNHMRASSEKVVHITLEMSESEARWLMSYMQNPHCEPEDESDKDNAMRGMFFDSLSEQIYDGI